MSPKCGSKSFMRHLPLLAGLAVVALSVSALAQSTEFPTYTPGENTSASTGPTYTAPLSNPWVASDGTILTPAGTQVYLGITTRAKAIALNPAGGTAAVLQMSAPQAVSIICVASAGCDGGTYTQGQVMQTFSYTNSSNYTNKNGSTKGIAYTSDGLHLLFSQDQDNNYNSWVSIADVSPTTGLITQNYAQVEVPLDATYTEVIPGYPPFPILNTVSCTQSVTFAELGVTMSSPVGTTGSLAIPCGIPYSFVDNFEYTSNYQVNTSYPTDIAIAPGNGTAYVVLNFNNELAQIDLSLANPPVEGPVVRVGNVPHSVVVNSTGTTAYVSNEAGQVPTSSQFQMYSNGTPVYAATPTGTTATGTVSVVNLSNFTVTDTITVGLHPTGMAFWTKGSTTYLLVANAYSDTISVINTKTNEVTHTVKLDSALPFKVLSGMTAGLGPNAIAVDNSNNAYVALYNANAIAVIDLSTYAVSGLIPVGYAPSSVVFDATDGELLVTNDKGIGTDGYGVAAPPTSTYENSYGKEFSVWDFNTHQDLGTASIISLPVPAATLSAMTTQVTYNNHWDLVENIENASGGKKTTPPVALPVKIGAPSLIKHVFLIVRENRTYDQILGDVAGGNGDASLAVFGDNAQSTAYDPAYNVITPNAHAIVQRFPLLDNYYDPSRQSADGHNWLLQAMAPYSDDIQSPDWLRDYPSNGGDSLAYQSAGHLFDVAAAAGLSMKIYGEYVEENTFNPPGCTPSLVTNSCEPSWVDFYNDTQCFEGGPNCAPPGTPGEATLYYEGTNSVGSYSPLPNVMNYVVQAYPQFDLGIPDQYRFDVWSQDFQNDVNNNSVPQLEMMWISSDHTGGPPAAIAMQTDNDLALGRFVSAISNSPIWSSSAIFVTEDDAQTGVDHVDGHRSPGYVISPYVIQSSGDAPYVDSTFYTQVNMTRTIEQILGLKPMNQNDLVASPMATLFLDNPPANNFLPFSYVANNPNSPPLYYGVSGYSPPSAPAVKAKATRKESAKVRALRAGWMAKKAEIFAGNYHKPDVEDTDTVNHLNWYEATGFTRPYPGENTVRPASDFNRGAPTKADDDD
jgi:YVTN family beta-propeller protein